MNTLSIAIPTYNNSKFLDILLGFQLPILDKYGLNIYICDNDSIDDTEQVVSKWKKKYSIVNYQKNQRHINSTANLKSVLNFAKGHFVWIMGDRYKIPETTILYVLESLKFNSKVDLFVLNLEGMVKNIPSKVYVDSENLLSDLGPVMTCISTLVINHKVINELDFNKFEDSSFGHFCSIFEYLDEKKIIVLWDLNYSVNAIIPDGIKRKNWSHDERVLSVGCQNWVESVFKLSENYSYDSKIRCIKDFGTLSKIFTFKGIALMRLRGNLTFSNYKKYAKEIALILKYPKFILILMSIFPRSILSFIYVLLTKLPKKISAKIGFKDI